MTQNINRRNFIKISGITGAGLLLQIPLVAKASKRLSENATFAPNVYLQINTNNSIIIFAKNPEIGQGVKTSLPMIIAEELGVDWNKIEVRHADLNPQFGAQFAGGSTSIKTNFDTLRKAGAAAREMLVQAAAEKWGLEVTDCYAESGFVYNKVNKNKLSYGELAETAAQLTVPENPTLKDIKDYKIIGKPIKNVDIKAIVTGAPIFGLDAKPKGMLTATVLRAPVYGGTIKSFDATEAKKIAGVVDVIEIKPTSPTVLVAGIAVVAKNTWAAMKGRNALKVEWELGDGATESSENIDKQFITNINKKGEIQLREDGNVDEAFANADKIIEATYEAPFLYHATMEPMNYIADVKEDSIECWGPTQVPGSVAGLGARITGIPREKIIVHQSRIGGGFGRRLMADYAAEAIYISHSIKAPVQVVWTREDDLHNGFFRPAGMYKLKAGLDKNGNITAWHINASTTSRGAFSGSRDSAHTTEVFPDGFPAGFVSNFRMEYTKVDSLVPRGAWRAPGHNATAFVDQTFLDELAVAAGKDSIKQRLELLGEEDKMMPYRDHGGPEYSTKRLKNVINLVAERSNWFKPAPKGIYRGFACHFMFGAYVAEVVEISLLSNGMPKIEKAYAVVDCGLVINKSNALNQLEGGIVDGLGAAMFGGVTIANGMAAQSNFDDYRMIRFKESPKIDAFLVESTENPEGLGEMTLPPISAALCNAIYAATGKRIYKLPLKDNEFFNQI
ncbi:MAG: xanthine dehydrogenase family protein molybdopterin-binding subunit [Saprospiraceae bacterium]|nr:xanthine dehydrogenase family protein molybdopterin-binding subunit [Saprospiraceae bacterium]